jgi:uncharacterized protein (UPF0210 family)
MKIRTITTFSNLSYPAKPEELESASSFNSTVRKRVEEKGFEVQETRIATNFFEGARISLGYEDVLAWVVNVETICSSFGVNWISLGTIRPGAKPQIYEAIPEIISQTETVSLSASISLSDGTPATPAIKEAARAMKRLSEETEAGVGNFRFGAIANCPASTPFFPSAFHDAGPRRFSIGFESGGWLYGVAEKSPNAEGAVVQLLEELTQKCRNLEEACKEISVQEGVEYVGADLSLNPGLLESESVCLAIEKLVGAELGSAGTLRMVALLTEALHKSGVKLCGYSGVFLPVLEDYGLAERANQGKIALPLLLSLASVCGAGLDAVPLPGDITVRKLEAILLDLATLSGRAGKPLSARLLPAPGKGAGEKTEFGLPFFIDCATIAV